jgi:predicted lipoprotein
MCHAGNAKAVLPNYEESKVKISIDRETLSVRVYAESTEALEQTACRFCSKTSECDHQIVKACFVPCG